MPRALVSVISSVGPNREHLLSRLQKSVCTLKHCHLRVQGCYWVVPWLRLWYWALEGDWLKQACWSLSLLLLPLVAWTWQLPHLHFRALWEHEPLPAGQQHGVGMHSRWDTRTPLCSDRCCGNDLQALWTQGEWHVKGAKAACSCS